MDRMNGIADTAKLVCAKPPTNGCAHQKTRITLAQDTSGLYRNFSGRSDIYNDNDYYVSSKVVNGNFKDLKKRANAWTTTVAAGDGDDDEDDILTNAVDIDAFQLPNKLWDDKIPNTNDGLIL